MVLGAASPLRAVPVDLRVVSSAPMDSGSNLEAVVAGPVVAGQGWKVAGPVAGLDPSLVMVTGAPVSARSLLMQLFFPGPGPDSYIGRFGIDVTTDAMPSAEARWMPLILEPASAADPSVNLNAVPVVMMEHRVAPFVVTLRARAPFDGITGFRLKAFPEKPSPGGKPRVAGDAAGSALQLPDDPAAATGDVPGRGPGGSFLLGGFRVESDTPRSSNLALGRQVYCSRQVQAGLPSRNLTDGFHATWSQPQTDAAQPEGFFQMDLGQIIPLDHLVVRRRPAPEGATPPAAYHVELLTESGGFDGTVVWRADRPAGRARRSADIIRADDGQGEFTGRRLIIHGQSVAGDQPQTAEIEVYPALKAEARSWLADDRLLAGTAGVRIPAGTRKLSFVPLCRTPAEGVHQCRWKLHGWSSDWQEAVLGAVVTLDPVPRPGEYRLEVQARHTDGVWDRTGLVSLVRAEPPWWNHAPSAVAVLLGSVVTAGAGGWFWFAHRLRRRLHRTEAHLELHRDRLRISRDMHDEIGARLTSIALLAERTQRQPDAAPRLLDDLAQQARTTVEALDTIVWAVNPRHDTVGGLQDYLCDYAPSYLAGGGMECRMDFRVSHPERPLALAVRHHLLMAAKEALQNAVKHSHGTLCTLTLTDQRNRLELGITDDGQGFGPEPPTGVSHTGMASMLQRLTEAGGSGEFLPGPDAKGACVRLIVPLEPF